MKSCSVGGAALLLLTSAAQAEGAAGDAAIVSSYYPAGALARGEEGTAAFHLDLDRGGRIERCAITRTSGFAELDAATCAMLVDKGRVDPDTMATRRNASLEGSIRWSIPADARAARSTMIAASVADLSQPSLAEPLVCRRATRPGTLVVQRTYCLSETNWGRSHANARAETHYLQGDGFVQ